MLNFKSKHSTYYISTNRIENINNEYMEKSPIISTDELHVVSYGHKNNLFIRGFMMAGN